MTPDYGLMFDSSPYTRYASGENGNVTVIACLKKGSAQLSDTTCVSEMPPHMDINGGWVLMCCLLQLINEYMESMSRSRASGGMI